ncbi:hypothetical protein B0H67DRAFT_608522 [Lasiosphaeris hirsuta]|uniref:Uncharacterized protein n=1 Tax=Lasiosphaeris hirsuta TaxID=260670 RepID=A0AA40APM5_9PEZI|nr:hypothetical protein B0H67DRAFT_608522 [Lasiosphaeris hirsuta]
MSSPIKPLEPGRSANQGPPNQEVTTPTTGRILDRGMEGRAIPHSLSSNLGQQSPSPLRSSPLTKPPGTSVREIVNWIEQASGSPRGPEQPKPQLVTRGGTSEVPAIIVTNDNVQSSENDVFFGRSDLRTNTSSASEESPRKAQTIERPHVLPIHPTFVTRSSIGDQDQSEVCSLTLCKHKEYLNNRPLGRCLDYLEQDQELKEKENETNTKKMDEKNSQQQQRAPAPVPAPISETQPSSPVEMLDSLMRELEALDFEKEYFEKDKLAMEKLEKDKLAKDKREKDDSKKETSEKRDPKEVKAFWDNVRAQLWIDDDEIYGDSSSAEDSEKGEGEMTPADDKRHEKGGRDGEDGGDELTPTGPSFPTRKSDGSDKPKPAPCPTRLPPPPPTPVLAAKKFSEHDLVFQSEPFPSWDPSSPSAYSPAESPQLGVSPPTVVVATPAVFTSLEDMYPEPELPSSFYTSQGRLPSSPPFAPNRAVDAGDSFLPRRPSQAASHSRHNLSRGPIGVARPRAPSSVYSRKDSDPAHSGPVPVPPRHAVTPSPNFPPALRRMTTEEKIEEIDAFFNKEMA